MGVARHSRIAQPTTDVVRSSVVAPRHERQIRETGALKDRQQGIDFAANGVEQEGAAVKWLKPEPARSAANDPARNRFARLGGCARVVEQLRADAAGRNGDK